MGRKSNIETIYFGGGCFWCIEAVFSKLKGVVNVVPGYAGGEKRNPTYEEVSNGTTGHAEIVKIVFDSNIVKLDDLLDVFWFTHDPTTINRQGNDIGTQYRSIILYTNEEQKQKVNDSIDKLVKENIFKDEIVTEVKKLKKFYEAEDYHHNYFEKNPRKAYCSFIIRPKVKKLSIKFKELLKNI